MKEHAMDFRLCLLKESGQIGDAVFEQVRGLVRFLEKCTGAELNEDNSAMLVTHFAVAAERLRRGEDVGAMEDTARRQVLASPSCERAAFLLDDWLAELNVLDAGNERDFLLLHLCVFLENLPET
ncbi:MAG: hypothetical protein LBQ90_04560 [Synergistaceae bacterium]|jgi:hypothetical protein|nr:hypothetical protein [Synergistaceae bacterium]